jgi:hypothetical protein
LNHIRTAASQLMSLYKQRPRAFAYCKVDF